jgi:hypothetical protein
VGRPSTPRTNRNLGESVITKRIEGDRKAGAQGASWWRRNPVARPRRAGTQKHGGIAKWLGPGCPFCCLSLKYS